MALRTAALRTFKRAPEEVARAEVPALVEGLRPMLSTLLGAVPTDGVLAQIQKELVGR
jgi:hypothetical protein